MFTKKIIPLFAIAIGLGLAVATSGFREGPKGRYDMLTFVYNPPTTNPYSHDNVVDKTHWKYEEGQTNCDGANEEACRIHVTSNDVVPNGSSYDLSSSFSISASAGSVSYVTSTSAGSGSTFVSNREQ